MTTVAYVDAELRARSDKYVRAHDQAASATERYSRTSQRAYRATESAQTKYERQSLRTVASSNKMGDAFSRAANSVAILDGPLGGVAGRLSSVAAGFRAGGAALTAFGAAAAGTAAMLKASISAYADLEVRVAKTDALLKATGYSAGYNGDQLDRMARKVALGTLASTAEIRDAIDVMLTFKSVSGSTFEEAITLAQDMSVVIGGTAKTAALQLGKALEDPVAGLTALKRSGVSFTASEKELVKQLVEANRVLEAQELILQKVADQLGGAGAAEASGLTGAVDTLSQRWEEMLETIGKTESVTSAGNALLAGLTRTVEDITYAIDPALQDQQKLFDDLVRQREDARARLMAVKFDDLSSIPLPGIYDKNDWWDDQRLMQSLNEQLSAMQEKRKQQDIAAGAAKRESELAAERAEQEREAAKLAERRAKAEERIAKAMESQLDKASFGSAGKALYNDIFGIQSPKRKTDGPVEENYYFRQATRAAQAQINNGHAVNSAGWLNNMRDIYERAMRDSAHNYNVAGMREVIKLMEDKAIAKFGDVEKAAKEQQEKGGSYSMRWGDRLIEGKTGGKEDASNRVLEITGESVNISMAAETAEAMGKEVRAWLDSANEKRGTDHGRLTIEIKKDDGTVSGEISGPSNLLKPLAALAQQAAARVS